MLFTSCARVGSPVGGDKDTLAPKFLSSNIDSPRVNVSRDLKELRLNFDEYVTLKNPQTQIIISPPIKNIKKIIPSNLANKYVFIQWSDTLRANTTYSFNFGNAIADYNEGNVVPYFNFAFSTGAKLDSLYISGMLRNAMLGNIKSTSSDKDKNFVVGLYQVKDTINFRQKPYYISKADKDGYFELNYLSPGKYKLIAFDDANGNSVYDPDKEDLGFIKNDITLDKSMSKQEIKLYPPQKKLVYKDMSVRDGGILMLFEGNPKNVSVKQVGGTIKDYKITHSPYSDSVGIWFNGTKEHLPADKGTMLKFSYDDGQKKDTVQMFYKSNPKEDLVLDRHNGGEIVPQLPLVISANMILDSINTKDWIFREDSLVSLPFRAKIVPENPFLVAVNADFKKNKKYTLVIPKESVFSFFQANQKNYAFEFKVGDSRNYGNLTLRLKNIPDMPFWIQLLDNQGKVVTERKIENKIEEIKYQTLKPSEYYVRILVDNNKDGYWETADLSSNTEAETVYLFSKKIEVRAMWDLVENWDLLSKEADVAKFSTLQGEFAPAKL
ncbi:Ig-like domain-containing protein [Riemerella columbipharyngis]|uniref:Ig-like domain-containing protein n=2 Tax=Riemerella columbipharyngis TaxID=1071918 RepID=A0A1G7ADK9_9FLAO|nr:Ig-like domain-containing protein [Riemerella columbipharyngis]